MKLITVVSDDGGTAFNHRRQSRDRVLIEHILSTTSGKKLWISPYSSPLFAGADVCVSANYLADADEEDYCFVELDSVSPYANRIDEILLYHWNRSYPSDQYFSFPSGEFHLVRQAEFAGHSHENITMEDYVKCP